MIGLIDYGAGNLRSVQNALERLEEPVQIVDRPEGLRGVAAIIFPGVGAAGPAMARLTQAGMADALRDAIGAGVPYLGICLGLQLLFDRSDEDDARGLGVLRGTVQRLQTREKVPHVGWNTIEIRRAHPVLSGLTGEAFYFVHSYVAVPRDGTRIIADTDHGGRFASVVAESHVIGTQFHPERSGPAGLRFLANFLALAGTGETIHAVQADHSVS